MKDYPKSPHLTFAGRSIAAGVYDMERTDALRKAIAELLYAAADSRDRGERAVLKALAAGLGLALETMEEPFCRRGETTLPGESSPGLAKRTSNWRCSIKRERP